MKEKTANKLMGAWFAFMLLLGLGTTGLMIWGAVEIIQWIGRH